MTTNTNLTNQVPYLRTSREYPEDIKKLTLELNKSYVDIANAVNNRTISIFPTNKSVVTGESWFLNSQRQQTLRKVYSPITSYTAFNHGIDINSVSIFTKITGVIFDGTNYLPIPYLDPAALNTSVGIRVNATQIQFLVAGFAPVPVSGFVLLEWLSNV